MSWRYTGDQLRSYNAVVTQQNRFRPVENIDLNFKYDFRPRLSCYFDIVNLKNKWPENYTGRDRGRITFADSYGTRYNMGVSGRF